MTQSTQKRDEETALSELIRATGIECESYESGEAPDFIVQVAGRSIGIEVTTFQSEARLGEHPKRGVEAAWEQLATLWRDNFQDRHKELADTSVLLRFLRAVPPKQKRFYFLQEILEFIHYKENLISDKFQLFWRDEFSSPLMIEYLWGIVLVRHEHGFFDSNLTAGALDPRPAETVAAIVSKKSGKKYREAKELWLMIQCSGRPSEMVLPFNGASELDACPSLIEALAASPFSRVFVFTALGLLGWDSDCRRWGAASFY